MTHTPTSGTFNNRTHILPIRVYYEDTDFSGIVYHANYLRYMERGRSDCLRLMGIHHHEMMTGDIPVAWTIVRMEIGFKAPARIDDALEVHTTYTKMTGARLFAHQEVRKSDTLLITAEIEAACITQTGKPTRIPKAAFDKLNHHLQQSK